MYFGNMIAVEFLNNEKHYTDVVGELIITQVDLTKAAPDHEKVIDQKSLKIENFACFKDYFN